jgi:hypothetical protein
MVGAPRRWLVASVLFGVALGPQLARSQDAAADPLLRWASAEIDRVNPRVDAVATRVFDHLGPVQYGDDPLHWWRHALATNGRKIETAGSGSYWVYDPVHHLAAMSEGGDAMGDSIFESAAPPAALPARDLSGVVSARGLRLGLSSAQAAHDLGVPLAAVKRISPREAVLYARAPRRCGPYACAHDATILFRDDRAVAISLLDVGP